MLLSTICEIALYFLEVDTLLDTHPKTDSIVPFEYL